MNLKSSESVVYNYHPSWGWAMATNSLSTTLFSSNTSNICFLVQPTLSEKGDGIICKSCLDV